MVFFIPIHDVDTLAIDIRIKNVEFFYKVKKIYESATYQIVQSCVRIDI